MSSSRSMFFELCLYWYWVYWVYCILAVKFLILMYEIEIPYAFDFSLTAVPEALGFIQVEIRYRVTSSRRSSILFIFTPLFFVEPFSHLNTVPDILIKSCLNVPLA